MEFVGFWGKTQSFNAEPTVRRACSGPRKKEPDPAHGRCLTLFEWAILGSKLIGRQFAGTHLGRLFATFAGSSDTAGP